MYLSEQSCCRLPCPLAGAHIETTRLGGVSSRATADAPRELCFRGSSRHVEFLLGKHHERQALPVPMGTIDAARPIISRTDVGPRDPMIERTAISAPSQCDASITSALEIPGKETLVTPRESDDLVWEDWPEDDRYIMVEHSPVAFDLN